MEGFEQTTSSYSSLIGTFASVSATHLVEESPTDIAKYGLDDPATEVIVTYQDDTQNVLHVGDELPTGDGRYVMVNDDPAVYTLGSTASASLENSILDYVDYQLLSLLGLLLLMKTIAALLPRLLRILNASILLEAL